METRIEVALKDGLVDATGLALESDIRDHGIDAIRGVRVVQVYLIEGDLEPAAATRIARDQIVDPVAEVFRVDDPLPVPDPPHETNGHGPAPVHEIKVIKKPGVTDPVGESARRQLQTLGTEVAAVRTARRVFLYGELDEAAQREIAERILSNPLIETVLYGDDPLPGPPQPLGYDFERIDVPIREADDNALMALSRDRALSLDAKEMTAIRDWYRSIDRDPTDVELDTIAQTWSEHCKHKTLGGPVDCGDRQYTNLLKQTIMQATRDLDLPWCVSVFHDNAGIIRFDDGHDICFKVETHNHPSALEPYGGAGTGIGGVIRDILGTGLGARPVVNTDVFCFGPLDLERDRVPQGALHPRRVMKGVVAGVRDYGNRMGIPTASGAVVFDERYVGNPLVYCGTVGILPRDMHEKGAHPGDRILVVGGRTGRDGIGGATFSSAELTTESETVSSGAVQIGHPIVEKKVLDTLLQARDQRLFTCVTDCGAGGLSSAVGEMGETLGARVDLERVPLKYAGLSYREIWISEAQERMVLSVPPENLEKIRAIFEAEDVEATDIGEFTDDRRLVLAYDGQIVCDLDMQFLHDGLPRTVRSATIPPAIPDEARESFENLNPVADYGPDLLRLLAAPNIASKEWIIRQYDHEVQGGLVIKPLQGVRSDGPGDCVVVTPVLGIRAGVAISNGIQPKFGDLDPYSMAASAIDEALRNLVAGGCPLDRVALLDNFSWGNTADPESLGALVLAAEACRDAALAYRTPFISGKDSLNNTFRIDDRLISIPPTLLISAIGVIDDISRSITMDAKESGNLLYLVGPTREELGGSHWLEQLGRPGVRVPRVDLDRGPAILRGLGEALKTVAVRACHDLSEGGLAVAAAEMAFAGGLGIELRLADMPVAEPEPTRDDVLLFAESNHRFLVEVPEGDASRFERVLGEVGLDAGEFARVGQITSDPRLKVYGREGASVLDESIEILRQTWREGVPW